MQRKWVVIVAVILGLLAAGSAYVLLQKQKEKLRVKAIPVLVAAREISAGATIDYDMLAFKLMPVNFIQPGVLRSRESAVGKTALATIMAGEQVLVTKLAAPGKGLTLAAKTPSGKRAFTIGLDAASAVGGMIMPGDYVDVLAIFPNTNPPLTLTLFQDVLILAVGQEMVPTEEGRARRGTEAVTAARRETITLALTPQEVQIFTVAMEQGKIRLTLRPRREPSEVLPAVDLSRLPPAVDLNTLLQFYIRRPKAGPSVEVIRGLEKEFTPLPAEK